jgi:hypothetical protein
MRLTAGRALWEASKNLLLLRDHLSCQAKFCPDCLCKHALLSESMVALALQRGAPCGPLLAVWPALRSVRYVVETQPDQLRRGGAEELVLALAELCRKLSCALGA